MNSVAARIVRPLIVILSCAALVSAGPARGGETIGQWNFSRRNDFNFDGEPDGWKRATGPSYPRYLSFSISPCDAAQAERMRVVDAKLLELWNGARVYAPALPALPPSVADWLVNRYLRAELDGGALQIVSPRVDAYSDYSYRLRMRMQTAGLEHDQAWAELVFYDGAGKIVQIVESERLEGSTEWTEIEIGPRSPPPAAVAVDVRLRLEPGAKPDMTGSAGFDDIRLDRLPRIRTESDRPLAIYAPGARPRVRCIVSGLPSQVGAVQFALCDEAERELSRTTVTLETAPATSHAARGPKPLPASVIGFGGMAEWQLPPLTAGFYRVKAQLVGRPAGEFDIEQTLAVLGDLPAGRGPYGWSLASGRATAVDPKLLPEWLEQCRVGWVKYPCWLAADDAAGIEDLGRLLRRFQDRGIETVGVLAAPPAETLTQLGARPGDPAALLLRDETSWQPLLEPIMARLAPEVRWWQLGGERDYSFLGRTQLTQLIAGIRNGLQGYGHPLRIVLSWPWLERLPPAPARSWEAVCLSDALQPTAAEITAYFDAEGIQSPQKSSAKAAEPSATAATAEEGEFADVEPWILLDPLPAGRYGRADRIRDLVLRMLVVRQQQIPAAFVSDPFDPDVAMLRSDGSPDEMLLPWRTAAALIGPLNPAGSIEMPRGSQNAALVDDTRAVLVVWSDTPQTEILYLGENVQQIDVWGRTHPVPEVVVGGSVYQRIEVGPEPLFLVNVDRTALLWRMQVQLEPQRLDSLLGREQTVHLRIKNPSSTLLSGSFRIESPEAWIVDRYARSIVAEPFQEQSQPISLILRSDATVGRQRIAIRFDLEGDRPRRFTVWRYLEIGPEDVRIEVTTRLLADGRLLVRPELSVDSDTSQDFDCYVYAPGRQRLRRGLPVAAGSTARQEFYLENGQQLIGQEMLLRAEQRGTGRTLNYRFRAQR